MNGEFINFIQRIEYNDNIDELTKIELINYIRGSLLTYVKVYSHEEYCMLEDILKDLEYDYLSFSKLLETSYRVRNTIGNNSLTIPKANYLKAIHTIFKRLDMDLWLYDNSFSLANMSIARAAYNIVFDCDVINNEIGIIDLTKLIYERYYKDNDVNRGVCKILKYLHWIKKGIEDLDVKYDKIVTSEEFYSLFELKDNLNALHLNELICEYYPRFKNELFVLIKNAVDNLVAGEISTDYVMKYLDNVIERRDAFNRQKENVVKEIEKIELTNEKNIEKTFSNLIHSINNNRRLDSSVSKHIINNIRNTFDNAVKVQSIFVENEFENLFNNCSDYINDLIIPSSLSKNGIDELINVLLNNCKDFFVEYDSKKFKEIVDYILENTDITVEELKGIGEKCAVFFKEADVNKLKAINNSLKEFKNYLDKNYDYDNLDYNIFEKILVNNPSLLLNSNKLNEILGFLKGEMSLDNCGYHYSNFRIPNKFLSYKFYKQLEKDNYKFFFEGSLGRLINNLNYLNEKCDICEVDFHDFKFNEDMLYTLLNNDLYVEGSNVLIDICDLFKGKDLQKLMELNPDLVIMRSDDLDVIIKRCILNENGDYNFYDLLVSELYFYKRDEFVSKSKHDLLNKEFKYINLGINTIKEYDVLDLITSKFIKGVDIEGINELYETKKSNEEKIYTFLSMLESEEINNSFQINVIVKDILDTYEALYSKVPFTSLKNKLVEIINDKKEKCEFEISDSNEELESKNSMILVYEKEEKDRDLAISQLNELIRMLDSESVRKDVQKLLTEFKNERKGRSENKKSEINETLKKLEAKIQKLDKEVELLNYLLSIADFDERSIDEVYEENKFFTIEELSNYKVENISFEDKIKELLEGENLVLFADQIDLSEVPNDKNFIEKVYKFLSDNEFSIVSKKFMEKNTLNADFVEKYLPPREKIWARRENRTPVRVYFIPIHTKYFACYYITGVNYKDHSHLDGGCPSDDVYKRRCREADCLGRLINELEGNELIRFINESQENYKKVMEPIISKIDAYNKRKGKK